MVKITTKMTGSKARKPRPDFPLFPHATGRWAKKVRGRLVYFGKVADDPKGQAALARWLEQKDDLLAGRTPRVAGDGLTVRDLCNRFLSNRQAKMLGRGAVAHKLCRLSRRVRQDREGFRPHPAGCRS